MRKQANESRAGPKKVGNNEVGDALAYVIDVPAIVALAEEDRHALRHVDAQKLVRVPDHRGHSREHDRLRHAVLGEELPPERRNLEVEFHDKGAVESLKYPALGQK
jgi:hypothetical protein